MELVWNGTIHPNVSEIKTVTTEQKEIAEILEDLQYWETCPDNIKEKLPRLIKSLSLSPVIVGCHECGDELAPTLNPVCGHCHVNN